MQTNESGGGGDRTTFMCDVCGLTLTLVNASGDDCPKCPGHFRPIHPGVVGDAVIKYGGRCEMEHCEQQAVVFYRDENNESHVRCVDHQYDRHIVFNEEAIQREFEELFKKIEERLGAETEMDKYDEK